MADKWTPPGLDRAEFERQEAHNERLIQVQMNRPIDRDFAPARGVPVGKREWKASDFVIDVGRHWDGYSFSVRDRGDPTILVGRGRGAATREDAVAAAHAVRDKEIHNHVGADATRHHEGITQDQRDAAPLSIAPATQNESAPATEATRACA
jgi:hypothetical protein